MKRLATITLLALGLLAPIALTGCGDDKASKPIEQSDLKVPPKDKAK